MEVTNHVVARCFKDEVETAFLRIWNEYHNVPMWYHATFIGFDWIDNIKEAEELEEEYQESIKDKTISLYN